uniref:Uncharacterized protein n=1 Tax=Ciona savignyi TaxID=51511 RepID=H2YMW0_CIOSA
MIGDDPTAAKWHFESCELVLGTDERNVPISSFNGAKNKLKFTHDIKRQTDFDSGIGSMTSSHSSQPNSPLNQDVKMPGGTSNGRITPDELMSTTQSVTQSFSNCHIGNGVSNVNIQIGLNNVMANGSSNGAVYQTAKYVPPVSGASGRSFNSELAFANIVNNQHKSFLMSIDLCKETNRRESFKNWKEAFSSQFVEDLARSGFFYLGNLDRTQCFSCAGVLRNWRPSDDVSSEHYRHFPNCKMLNNNELRNVEIPVKAAPSEIPEPADPSPEQLAELGKLFKLNNPINPHMRDVSARVATFDQRWPSRKVKASPTHIAKAGFYFLG